METWLRWLDWLPAEAIIVVSEMGEQWSPQTAPARHALIPMMSNSLPGSKIAATMGMRIPNVPQDVPVEKARTQATIKMIAGRKFARPAAALSISVATNTSAPKRPVMFLRAVANVRIKIAGTIALKPLGMHSIASLKVTSFLAIR